VKACEQLNITLRLCIRQVNSDCADVDCHHQPIVPESCLINQHKQSYADLSCDVVRGELFQACHPFVDFGIYYYNCRWDMFLA